MKDAAGRFADGAAMRRALADAREAIESELPGLATDLPPAQPTDETVLRSSLGRPSVLGATALAPAAAVRSQPPTHRPDATVSAGGPATGLPASTHRPWTLVLGGAGLALLGVAVVAAMWFRFAGGVQPARVGGGQEQASTVADLFVANQIELARGDVADGEYERAAERAEEALKLNPASAEARQLRDQARQALRRIDEAVTEARTAFARGDVTAASQALGRVMALAPRHPVVAELSAALKRHFRPQADDARLLADAARKRAEGARATSSADYERGRQLATDADASFRGEDYASAAQRYLESRIAFERARRLAEDARAAATSSPAVHRGVPPTTVASAPAASAPIVAPPPSVAAPPVAAAATGGPAPAPTTSVAPAARSAPSDSAEAEVRRVIAEYGRAIGSHDLALFRAVKPNLTTDEEKRLREAFKAVKSQAVGINVESVQIEGDRALVRATRQDTVDGRTMSPIPQAFHLARSGGSWAIQSIGQ